MTAIQELAKLMIHDVRKKQNLFTRKNRKQALTLIEQALNRPDSEIITTAKAQKHWIIDQGKFGIRGYAGSHFLKQIDHFIIQAEYLILNDPTAPQTAIKRLAKLAIEDIQAKQNKNTAKSRLDAVEAIKNCVDDKYGNYSDEMVIRLVQLQRDKVIQSRQFGLRGQSGSNFLSKINLFLHQAQHLMKKFNISSPKPNDNKIEIPQITQARDTLFSRQSPVREDAINKKLRLQDQERDKLEKEITSGLELYYQNLNPYQRITSLWNYHLQKVKNKEKLMTDCNVFENEEYKSLTDIPLDLQEKITAYSKILLDPLYKNYIREQSNNDAYEEDARTKALQKNMDEFEQRMEESGANLVKAMHGM